MIGTSAIGEKGKEQRNDKSAYIFRAFRISCFIMACSLYGVADDKGLNKVKEQTMSRYYKVEDVERVLKELADEPHYQHYDDDWSMGVAIAESRIEDLPTIEVSEDCISKEYLKSFEYINKGDFNSVETIREWIDNAPSVVPTQTNTNQCVQRVEYVGDIEKKRCRTCKHFKSEFHTPISSDGTYYPYVICTEKECIYKEKG